MDDPTPYTIARKLRFLASKLTLLDVLMSGNPTRILRRMRNMWIGRNIIPEVWDVFGVRTRHIKNIDNDEN